LYRPPITDLNVIREREETDQVYIFLAVLDPTYEPIRAQILLSTEQLTFDSVTALIRQEATRRVAMGTSDSNLKPEAQAFVAQTLVSKKANQRGRFIDVSIAKRMGICKINVGYYIPISDPSDHGRELSDAWKP
jgi:hypothetical protein